MSTQQEEDMHDFYFHMSTKFYYGKGVVAQIADEVLNYGNKVFFIYDEIPATVSGAHDLIHKVCEEKGITVTDFTGIEPNPAHTTIDRARALLSKVGADVVIALGGGSTVDSAKAMCLTANYDGSCWEVFENAAKIESLSTQGKKEENVLPLITIPTIAASGSEVSNVAVIANHDLNMKLDYRSDALRPVAVFTDPTYTYTVPPFQTACGILDIMSHSYEGYFSHSTGSMQDGISETIQKTCITHGRKVMQIPRCYDSRAQLLWAAQWSIAHLSDQGRNFIGSIHSTERVIGNYFGFPHGAGIAIMSIAWFKYALNDQTAYRFARWAKNVWGVNPALDEMTAAREGIQRYEAFVKELGVPTRLSQSRLNVSKELVEKCADEVWERVNTANWFKPLSSKQELLDYMMLAWE